MSLPFRVAIDASNQPTDAQNYEHGASAVSTYLSPETELQSGYPYLLLAEQIDGSGNPSGAWEISDVIWTQGSPSTFNTRTLVRSSTGSLINWSTVGATPRLKVLTAPSNLGRYLHSFGTVGTQATIEIGGASNPFIANRDYDIVFTNLSISTSALVQMRWFQSGVGIDSTGTDHTEALIGGAGASSLADYNIGDTLHNLVPSNTQHNPASNLFINLELYDPMDSFYPRARSTTFYQFSGNRGEIMGLLTKSTTMQVSGIQLLLSAGNFTGGTWQCWGKYK